jgi:hypothetical protein
MDKTRFYNIIGATITDADITEGVVTLYVEFLNKPATSNQRCAAVCLRGCDELNVDYNCGTEIYWN